MLEDCQVGLERICQPFGNLQRLSRKAGEDRASLDLRRSSINRSPSPGIRSTSRALDPDFRDVPACMKRASLGQVFLNLLSMPPRHPGGQASRNEISVARNREGLRGGRNSRHRWEFRPKFCRTVRAVLHDQAWASHGLGLSISRQTVTDHGGHMVFRASRRGSVSACSCRRGAGAHLGGEPFAKPSQPDPARKRVLVIDDEP